MPVWPPHSPLDSATSTARGGRRSVSWINDSSYREAYPLSIETLDAGNLNRLRCLRVRQYHLARSHASGGAFHLYQGMETIGHERGGKRRRT
jgi:hypothetical protein